MFAQLFAGSRDNEAYNDVIVVAKSKRFSTNRFVLNCYSLFFEEIFKNDPKNPEIELNVDDVNRLEVLIDFVNSGKININKQNVFKLLKLANYLKPNEVMKFGFCCVLIYSNNNRIFGSISILNFS